MQLDRIKSMTIDNNEKTLIICEKFAEVQDLASFLDSTGITYRVAQHLESECKLQITIHQLIIYK